MSPFSLVPGRTGSRVVITCEHASNHVPEEYGDLGIAPEVLEEHVAWDLGAGRVSAFLADMLSAPAILSQTSRLVIDCNRDEEDHDLIVHVSDGIEIPGNRDIDRAERERRLARFHRPYHQAIDEVLTEHRSAIVVSVHSFTPALRSDPISSARSFDVGILFDDHQQHAERLGGALTNSGFAVRYNQPYSGFAGLIFSASSHGRRHGRVYLELEVNNGLVRSDDEALRVTQSIAKALRSLLEEK